MKGFGEQSKSRDKKFQNSSSTISSKELLNKALKCHSKGNTKEAKTYYEIYLKSGFLDPRVFCNLAVILKNLGNSKEAFNILNKGIDYYPKYAELYCNLGNLKRELGELEEAELLTRKAIEIKPNYFDAHTNLGAILQDLGRLNDAKSSTLRAIQIKGNITTAHLNLGSILDDQGCIEEAEESTRRAIELDPELEIGFINLIEILKNQCKHQEAISLCIEAIEKFPDNQFFYQSTAKLIKYINLSEYKLNDIEQLLEILLDRIDLDHQDLFSVVSKILENYRKSYSFNPLNRIIDEPFFAFFSNHPIIIKSLSKLIFSSLYWESFLTQVRREICLEVASNHHLKKDINKDFINYLAQQCFYNEYIYKVLDSEKESLISILNRCKGEKFNEIDISILSSYYPIHKFIDSVSDLCNYNSLNNSFNQLLLTQYHEPLDEIRIGKSLKVFGSIKDETSLNVKDQYEEYPYPRWIYTEFKRAAKSSFTKVINHEIRPNKILSKPIQKESSVLIAGCGTGQQVVNAQRYKNAKITAIDLSSSSLAYAQRKITQLGIKNVRFIHMDILDLPKLNQKFDVIESSGVIHHMHNPSDGLKALSSALKGNGFIKLGLYSQIARDRLGDEAKIMSENIDEEDDRLVEIRQQIIAKNNSNSSRLFRINDFYTRSMFRDLCLHVKEHRFTIIQLRDFLDESHLRFLGFLLPQSIKSDYLLSYPDDPYQLDLDNWNEFELNNPSTFLAMYQFWASRM